MDTITMDTLIERLKAEVIEELNLEDFTTDDINTDDALFGGDYGLDSIDALELIVLLERNYKLRIEDPEKGRDILYSIQTIASYIKENGKA